MIVLLHPLRRIVHMLIFFFRVLQVPAKPFFIKLFATIFDQKGTLFYVLLHLELLLFYYQVAVPLILDLKFLLNALLMALAILQDSSN